MEQILNIAFAFVFIACISYAMISDFTQLRIPNTVSLILLLLFPLYALTSEMPNVLLHLYLAGALFVLFFIFFALGWLKAADVKFMTVLILWAGPTYGIRFILFLALFSAVFGVLLSALRYALLQHPEIADKPFASKVSRLARNGIVPYGLPIGLAALCVVPAIFMQGL